MTFPARVTKWANFIPPLYQNALMLGSFETVILRRVCGFVASLKHADRGGLKSVVQITVGYSAENSLSIFIRGGEGHS